MIKKNLASLRFAFRKKANRKGIPLLVLDIIKWVIRGKGGLIYFPLMHLEEKTNKVSDFITTPEFHKIHDKLNILYYRPVLEDKLIFDRVLKGFHINMPETIAIIEKDNITWLETQHTEKLENICRTDLNVFVKKITSWGGHNVFKLEIHNGEIYVNNKESTFECFTNKLHTAKYILQKTITQHEEMSRLNPNCVNTIRINTIHQGEQIEIFSYFLRIGKGESVVDNVSSGNIYAGIHNNGQLFNYAIHEGDVPVYLSTHPDSNCPFESVNIPFWEEAKNLCLKTHGCIDYFFIIGWDIALTPTGPVIIEGNPVGELFCQQSLYGGLKHQLLDAAKKFETNKLPYIEPN